MRPTAIRDGVNAMKMGLVLLVLVSSVALFSGAAAAQGPPGLEKRFSPPDLECVPCVGLVGNAIALGTALVLVVATVSAQSRLGR